MGREGDRIGMRGMEVRIGGKRTERENAEEGTITDGEAVNIERG